MAYKHLTTRELTLAADFYRQGTKAYLAAKSLKYSTETIYKIYRFLDTGKTITQYLDQYNRNKRRCGRKPMTLSDDEVSYITKKVRKGWTPDTIIGRAEKRSVVVCGRFTECSLVVNMALRLNNYR